MDVLVIDEWHDWWRLGIFLVAVACLVLLVHHFYTNRESWHERARDRWFMKLMWVLAAGQMQIEGLATDAPLRYRLIFVTAAILVTLRLLTKRSYADDETASA